MQALVFLLKVCAFILHLFQTTASYSAKAYLSGIVGMCLLGVYMFSLNKYVEYKIPNKKLIIISISGSVFWFVVFAFELDNQVLTKGLSEVAIVSRSNSLWADARS